MEAVNKEASEAKKTKKITFRCRFCGRSKPLDKMELLTRFFPPIVACRDCERKMR
jgi:hypothetical protein